MSSFLGLGVMSYGGPAIMGIMRAALQEKRQWVSKDRFVEGLSLVRMLPGAVQHNSAYISATPAAVGGGLLAGACFVLPVFLILRYRAVLFAGETLLTR
jgi:chromate transporter